MTKQHSFAGKLAIQSFAEFIGELGHSQPSALRTNTPDALAQNATLAFVEIALCFGFGLTTAVFFAYRISGGALNPAVNFGLFVAGIMDIPTLTAFTIAQLAGASAACATVSFAFPGDFQGANALLVGVSYEQGFVIEAVLTAGLVLTVLFLAVEKSKITFAAPFMIGLYVFIAHVISIPYTNTSINPARTFGASVITGSWDQHELFWLAPLAGAGAAGIVYRVFKALDYETVNPGQDSDGTEMIEEIDVFTETVEGVVGEGKFKEE
ncbi:hypothetical protein HDU98_003943 [Podochytrium sp. JEL0797]|nr:hypothetical protein HDU98_003943 [Podochytrium sp. JEL0797]